MNADLIVTNGRFTALDRSKPTATAVAALTRQERSSPTSQFMLPQLSHRSKTDVQRFGNFAASTD
jgi:hypothetical protein